MNISFCFNELSLDSKYYDLPIQPSIQYCFNNMAKIFATLKTKYKTEKITLRTKNSLWGLSYNGQSLGTCINTIDRDTRNLIMQVSDKSPYFDSDEVETKYFYRNKYAEGLTAALLYDSFLLSFPTATVWKEIGLQIKNGSDQRTVINTAESSMIDEAVSSYKGFEYRRQYVLSFADLYNADKTHFEHIKFHDKIEKQLASVDKRFLEESLEALCKIELFLNGENVSPLNFKSLFTKSSGESDSVENNPDLREKRVFAFSGKQIECFDHVKFNDGLRIHYNCDFGNKVCYIGYIGNHLPTALY